MAACTPTPQPASIAGTVVDGDTLAPLAGADVIARAAGTADVLATDVSDALGAFDLDSLAAGVYDVELSLTTYASRLVEGVVAPPTGSANVGDLRLLPAAP